MPKCPPEKEKAIMAAFKHFSMIVTFHGVGKYGIVIRGSLESLITLCIQIELYQKMRIPRISVWLALAF